MLKVSSILFKRILLLGGMIFGGTGIGRICAAEDAVDGRRKPNVLFIVADDLRRIFADKQRVVMEIERNGSIMYRLRVAGFVDRNAARDFCLNLKARGQDCIATRMR